MMADFPDCDVKLCDFEISRVILEGTEIREILGTPDYVGKFQNLIIIFMFWLIRKISYFPSRLSLPVYIFYIFFYILCTSNFLVQYSIGLWIR